MAAKDDWLIRRAMGIGGSDVPCILGKSRFKGPHDIWMSKKPVIDKLGLEWPPKQQVKRVFTRGHEMEPLIADYFAKKSGFAVHESFVDMYQSPEVPYLQASLDREVWSGDEFLGIHEIKSVGWHSRWQGVLPEHVWLQVQHYLFVRKDAPRAYVSAIIAQTEEVFDAITSGAMSLSDAVTVGLCIYEEHIVQRCPSYEADVVPELENFWELVVNGTPPEADGTEGCEQALMHNSGGFDSNKEATMTDDMRVSMCEYKRHKDLEKHHKAEAAVEKTKIMQMLGDCGFARSDFGRVKLSVTEKSRFSQRAWEESRPEQYAEVTQSFTRTVRERPRLTITIKEVEGDTDEP